MDRIDHYPQFQNQDDLHAGRIAGEIRALREQQETMYYRDQAVIDSRTEVQPSVTRKKSKSQQELDEARCQGLDQMTMNLIAAYPKLKPNEKIEESMSESVGGFIVFVFVFFLVYALFFLITSIFG